MRHVPATVPAETEPATEKRLPTMRSDHAPVTLMPNGTRMQWGANGASIAGKEIRPSIENIPPSTGQRTRGNNNDDNREVKKSMGNKASISFGPTDGQTMGVTRDGEPAGRIRKFGRFECEAWTYDHDGTSLVGPLSEVKATLRRHAEQR